MNGTVGAEPERIAVIVGVGQVNDRPDDAASGMEPLALMRAALGAADRDAGGGWLADLDRLAVVEQISFRAHNPLGERLAQAIGATPAHVCQSDGPNGDSPIRLLNEAANAVARGEARVAAVVGGEALRTASARAARAARTDVSAQNPLRALAGARPPGYRQRHGLSTPVDVYPLYENAGRAAYGQTLAEGQRETGELWSRLAGVAAQTPAAWLHRHYTPEQIVTPSADNRPIAFPYTKLCVANSSVNQGAGFIVTSLAEARRRGVAEARIVYVGRGAGAHEADDFLARDRYDASPAMIASLDHALEWNGVDAHELDLVELYSCFPCVPKMARRVIGWPVEKAATVFGGLTFGGGPIGNYMSHAVAEMVDALRGGEGAIGLLYANGGYATHHHAIVLATHPLPGIGQVHDFNVQAAADALRGPVPGIDKDYVGPATIETYTIFYARDGHARSGVVVARTPDGNRTLAKVRADDAAMIAWLTDGATEPVGQSGEIVREGEDTVWHCTVA